MSTEVLLSGALGALIATVIALAVGAWRDQVTLRGRVAIDVAVWLEDVNAAREEYFTARAVLDSALSKSANRELALHFEDRFLALSARLLMLARSKVLVVKVALAHGEGSMADSANQLQQRVEKLVFQEVEIIKAKGLAGLGDPIIGALRQDLDREQEQFLTRLVRTGSLPEAARRSWDGERSAPPASRKQNAV
jgi:hypothetical protein